MENVLIEKLIEIPQPDGFSKYSWQVVAKSNFETVLATIKQLMIDMEQFNHEDFAIIDCETGRELNVLTCYFEPDGKFMTIWSY